MILEENNLEGKQYSFIKSIQVDEWEELRRKCRTELLFKKLQVRDQNRGETWSSCEETKRSLVLSVKERTQ